MITNTHSNDGTCTLATVRSKVQLIILLAEQLAFLLHKSTVHQRHTAVRIGTNEMIWTPRLIQRRYKRTSAGKSELINNHSHGRQQHKFTIHVSFTSQKHDLHTHIINSLHYAVTKDHMYCKQRLIYIVKRQTHPTVHTMRDHPPSSYRTNSVSSHIALEHLKWSH